jgi:hypothetical protein
MLASISSMVQAWIDCSSLRAAMNTALQRRHEAVAAAGRSSAPAYLERDPLFFTIS